MLAHASAGAFIKEWSNPGGVLQRSARPLRRRWLRDACVVAAPAGLRVRDQRRPYLCGRRSGRGRSTAPSRSRAHASRTFARGVTPPVGSQAFLMHVRDDLLLGQWRAVMPVDHDVHREPPRRTTMRRWLLVASHQSYWYPLSPRFAGPPSQVLVRPPSGNDEFGVGPPSIYQGNRPRLPVYRH